MKGVNDIITLCRDSYNKINRPAAMLLSAFCEGKMSVGFTPCVVWREMWYYRVITVMGKKQLGCVQSSGLLKNSKSRGWAYGNKCGVFSLVHCSFRRMQH